MSSAKKHKQRSHRSYRNSVATAEHFQNRQILKVSQQKAMKEKSNLLPLKKGKLLCVRKATCRFQTSPGIL